jgi:hypothetical protein
MDRDHHDKTRRCPVCGGSRWWRSHTGPAICHQCHSDPMEALQVLGDQTRGQCRMPDSSPLADRGDTVSTGSAG